MPTDLERAYIAARWRILTGDLQPGEPILHKEAAEQFGIGQKRALKLLGSLASDGYVYRKGRIFRVAAWSHDQLEEWRQVLGAFAEIGAGRLAVEGDKRLLEQMRQHVAATLARWDACEERFFLAGLELSGLILGGPKNDLVRLVANLIPPAFFRLLWLADSQSENGPLLLRAAERLIEVVPGGSVTEAKAACSLYFGGVADALHAQLDSARQGVLDKAENRIVEPRLNGHTNLIMESVGPKYLLPLLRDTKPAAAAIQMN